MTLEHREGSGNLSSSEKEPQSLEENTTPFRDRQEGSSAKEIRSGPRAPHRSSSPAKRPASLMEGTGESAAPSAKDIHGSSMHSANSEADNGPSSPLSTMTSARTQQDVEEDRQERSISVDMVDSDRVPRASNDTSANSATTPSSNQGSGTSATSFAGDSPAGSADKMTNGGEGAMESGSSVPSLDDQYRDIMRLVMQPIQDGQEGYVIASRWLARVLSRTPLAKEQGPYEKEASEGEIGPVDNSHLAADGYDDDLSDENGDDFVPLKAGLSTTSDMEILPAEAWNKIVGWYGLKQGSPIIRRFAHNTSPEDSLMENIQYELFPPIFTIRKLRNDSDGLSTNTIKEASAKAPRILASRDGSFQEFLKAAKTQAGIDMKTKVKVWRVLETLPADDSGDGRSGMLTPATSRSGSPASGAPLQPRPNLLIDMNTFTSMTEGSQREMVDVKDETNNPNGNGHLKLSTVGLSQDQTLLLEEQIGGPGGGEFVSDTLHATAAKNGVSLGVTKTGFGKQMSRGAASSRANSPASSGPVTRGRTRRDGRTRGTVGLTNLGNTCYMNSGLQCIRSCEELTIYFLSEQYKKELNPDNPLSHGGAIAKTYASLLHSIYDDTNTTSFTPRVFKNVLGRYAPTFSGYGQQDSQEFLSFLVDGIHEDLNRILKKPYVENPESDDNTVNDPDAIRELGQKFRKIHHARNDSVAMDLFNGFYKNTMVCPICDKVSITFDPYSLLTLQLPIEHTWQHIIEFVPLHGRPVQVAVDIDKNASIRALKEYVAKRIPGVNPKQLMMAEIYTHKFYKTFEDNITIAECSIQSRDELVMYELESVPTNFPPPKKPYRVRTMLSWNQSDDDEIPEADSPLAERMLVPIFHRQTISGGYSSTIKKGLTLWPSFVIITKDEAKDIYEIHRKVLGQVAQMTTKDIFEDKFLDLVSYNGSDVVLTTEEDASSNADPNIKASSIEGDESIVDVTMTENIDTPAEPTPEAGAPASNAPARQRHPTLKQGEHLPIALNELFTMKVSKSNGKEMIQTGWSSIDANRDYPTIESRIPKSRRSSIQSNRSSASTRSTGSEQSDHAQFSHNDTTFNGDSDSDSDLPPVSELAMQRDFRQKRNGNRSKRSKALKTYSLKGKGVRRDPSEAPTENEEMVDAPLIKLGEAIVCDWEPALFEALFEGQDENDSFRGVDTWSVMERLHDPELEAKQAKRAARKKTGITLEECFAETAKGEILSEENAWYCNRCKELRRANKKLEIWTVPDILVIHLKRFSAHRGLRDKIDVLVDFPTENLDLKDWVGLPEDKGTVYDLFAVDNHYGGLGGGHYTAFAQNFYDHKWYEYNDSQVSQRNPLSVVTPAAYLLFYRRRSDKPLGPEPLQKLVLNWRNPPTEDQVENPERNASESRASSPNSGNGKGAHGSSPNGSSSASAAVAAARQRGGGSEKGTGRLPGPVTMSGNADDPTLGVDDELPGYDEDEGIGGMGPMNRNIMPGQMDWNQQEWSFGGVINRDDDADSTQAAGGSYSNDDLSQRMIQDFGSDTEDVADARLRAGMPSPQSEQMPELLGGLAGDEDEVIQSTEMETGAPIQMQVPMDLDDREMSRGFEVGTLGHEDDGDGSVAEVTVGGTGDELD